MFCYITERNAKVCNENCGHDERRETICFTRWAHYTVAGKESKTKIRLNRLECTKLGLIKNGSVYVCQIENEYNLVEEAFHEKGKSYVRWAANMAVGLQTGVPWVMCKQDDAPDPVVSLISFVL